MVIIEDSRQQTDKHTIKHQWFAENGVLLVRSKLPYGDYASAPKVSIDTKRNMDEIAGNICGSHKEHVRFINECKRAKDADCQLYVLVENDVGINDLSEVHTWVNPRSAISPTCVQGTRLQKAMETIQERYNVRFLFCEPSNAAKIIMELIKQYE